MEDPRKSIEFDVAATAPQFWSFFWRLSSEAYKMKVYQSIGHFSGPQILRLQEDGILSSGGALKRICQVYGFFEGDVPHQCWTALKQLMLCTKYNTFVS